MLDAHPPRPVLPRYPALDLLARVLPVLYAAIGLVLLVGLAWALLCAYASTQLTAHVVDATREKHGSSTVYTLKYAWNSGSGEHATFSTVTKDVYAANTDAAGHATGAPVPVWQFEIAGFSRSRFSEHANWHDYKSIVLWNVLFHLVVGGLVFLLVLVPRRSKSLVREGSAAAGSIVETRSFLFGLVRFARYRFQPGEGRTVESWMPVWQLRPRIENGTAVTVFFDPRTPERSVAYEPGPWRLAPVASSETA